jgi:NADH-quinone oxidoreductase subunit L
MSNYPQLVPLVILIPAVGAFINFFWGARLRENGAAIVGTVAAALAFIVSLLLYSYVNSTGAIAGAVVNPPFFDGWLRIESIGLEIPWQMRVDSLSVTMMLVVSGVGSLIHMYAIGYMHGDPRFSRFFAYLNMFLAFMMILVTGNNFLMLFVGWEGVGLCSFLLIGFWFDKAHGEGWKNSNAAKKAFIANRVGDFGFLMGVFLIFWTFGTLDFFKPGELANPHFVETVVSGGGHGEEGAEGAAAAEGEAHGEEGAAVASEGEIAAEAEAHGEETAAVASEGEEAGAVASEGETVAVAAEAEAEEEHGGAFVPEYLDNEHIPTEQLGVFGKAERWLYEGDHVVDFGPFSLPLETVIVIITLFLLLGATGKSAQIPLFVWLPDAMAGPTPVSALIHAATMVTAGVYMMVRSNILFYNADLTSFIVAIIGAATAIMAGFVAIGQWDIKRVLAYSTISQLGFMVAAVGVGAYGAAMFHLVTHAFFKALLFLGSGSVIHGMEHGHHALHGGHGVEHEHGDESGHDAQNEQAVVHVGSHDIVPHHEEEKFDPQDMRTMGGLSTRMPITYITYLIGTLALAGIFPFAGFWSKDEILADSWLAGLGNNDLGGFIAFGVLLAAAGFTAFYMWRQVELVFHNKPRHEAAAHASESSPVMTIPLMVLGFFSIFIGFMNVPSGVLGLDNIFGAHVFTTWLEGSVAKAHAAEFQPFIAIFALGIGIGAIIWARRTYHKPEPLTEPEHQDPLQVRQETGGIFALANARLYWDEVYNMIFINPFKRASTFLADTLDWRFWHDYFHNDIIGKGFNALGNLLSQPVDLGIIDGVVNGVGRLIGWFSGRLRRVQTGYVRTYAIGLLLGVVAVLVILLLPLLQNGG